MATKTKRSTRWSIGLFRNGSGKLVAAYVTADGKPMASERKRVGDKKSLHNGVYDQQAEGAGDERGGAWSLP